MLKGPPASILFVDVETTGLHSADRIVSLGAIRLSTFEMLTGVLQFDQIHLIFDPGRKSHPKAEEVHGYDDWILRHQQPFSDYAAPLFDFISSAGLVVAHNAEFDKSFLAREFEAAGLQIPLCSHIARCRPIEAGVSAEARRFRQSARALRSDNAAKGMTRFKTPGWRCRSIFGFTKACFGKRHFP